MSGDESIRRFDAGELANIPDDEEHRNVVNLALMIGFGPQDPYIGGQNPGLKSGADRTKPFQG